MGRSDWYKKWQMNKSFIIENDRLKKKSYIYAPFPRMNQYGFQNGDIRKIVSADILARYQRMQDMNVLFPVGFHSLGSTSFIESKKLNNSLDDKISDVFYHQMLELGIGINDAKLINMRHDEYVEGLQLAFLDLYDRKYIDYKTTQIYQDKENNKIYDSLNKPDTKLSVNSMKCFSLLIGNLVPQIVKDIKQLNCSEEVKEELLNSLMPVKTMNLELALSNGGVLSIDMTNPEFLGGISFIFLNPEYIDISKYTTIDEYYSVMKYLDSDDGVFAYSGVQAINPLTGNQIPLFISTLYQSDIYLGIPGIDDDDRTLAENYELEIIEIIENDIFINSDLLDGLTIEKAHNKIFEVFIEADIATKSIKYSKSEINLSSLDGFGPLYPFLMDKGSRSLNSLREYLPYTFSSQFRPVLNANVDVSGESLSGTINNLFVEGLCPILSILYDEISSGESIFSDISREEYEAWTPIDCMIVDKNNLNAQLLMPIVFHNIIKKEIGYTIPDLFKKVIVVPNTLDIVENEIKRSNNNLIDFEATLNNYYADSLRYFCLSSPLEEEFIFNKYVLEDIDNVVKRLEDVLLKTQDVDSSRLDYYFYNFVGQCKNHLDNHNVYGYVRKVETFINEFIFKEIFSKSQLLLFLKAIFPLFPYLAEEVYEKIFKSRYSIINEGWPS